MESPVEVLELRDGQSITFRIERFVKGRLRIHPRWPGAPPEKEVEVLRIWVPKAYKPFFPPYWDITSNRLRAELEGFLQRPDVYNLEFKVTAFGSAPRTRYTVEVRAAR